MTPSFVKCREAIMIGPDEVEFLVVGTGLMGASLAQAFAQEGVSVGLAGRRQESLNRARAFIQFELEEAAGKGIFSRSQVGEIAGRIHSGTSLQEACRGKNLRLVVESVSENLVLKKELFNWLDEFSPPDVVLATNTSCLDAEVLAAETRTPERVLWVHFFFPAHKNHAAEVSGLSRTSGKSLETAVSFLLRARKSPVRLLRYRKGGVANIIFVGLLLEAFRMLDEGYGTSGVEGAAAAAFGMPVGFVRLLQGIGLDLAASCLESFSDPSFPEHPLACAYDNFFSPPARLRQKFAEARESGKLISVEQFLTPGRTPRPDQPQMVESLRRRFLAVAFMTASEVVEAGLSIPADVDRLCQTAFRWPAGPFSLMNRTGTAAAFELVSERLELSNRQQIRFPIPRNLAEQARKNEPWPLP
jgi:3-hydroxyacyl-CoA dehydrogenase